jgi:hypothetical protein
LVKEISNPLFIHQLSARFNIDCRFSGLLEKMQTSSAYANRFNFTLFSNTSLVGGYYSTTLPLVYNFLPIPNYVLHMNIINNGITLGNNSTISTCDVLLTIPNNGRNNAQTIYESGSNNEFLVKNWDLRNLQMRITDTKNRELDFNGVSSYLTLRFNIYRTMAIRPKKFNEILAESHSIELPYLEETD